MQQNASHLAIATTTEDRPLRRAEAADFLSELGYPIAKRTLDVLATRGGGPSFRYFGRLPLYTKAALIEWVESRLSAQVTSTSDFAA